MVHGTQRQSSLRSQMWGWCLSKSISRGSSQWGNTIQPRAWTASQHRRGDQGQQDSRLPLTYEQYEDQAEFIQVDMWVGERVAEGGVDDHKEHAAADHAEGGLLSLQPVLDVSADNLKHRDQQVASSLRCREWNWASQNDSDSAKTEWEENNLDVGHNGLQSFPASPLFFWGIQYLWCNFHWVSIMRVDFQPHSNPSLITPNALC